MILKRVKILVFLILILVSSVNAQNKIVNERKLIWPQYFLKLNYGKASFNLDGSDRYEKNSHFQLILRGGLEYKINKMIDISAGYVYSEYYTVNKRTRLEHRPWEQVMVKKDFKKINLSLRYRLEHRFIKNSNETHYTFSTHRHRFQINTLLPIWKKEEKQIGIVLADEIFLNQGKSVNLFDQNRIISGVQYQWKKGNFVALTYQNMYQQKKVADTYDNFDILRVVIQQSFQFKKS